MFRKKWLLAGLASAAIVTAGYTYGPSLAQATTQVCMDHAGPMAFNHFTKQLHLTPAQHQKLKAIAEKYRAQTKSAGLLPQHQELKKLLSAPQLDKNALKALLEAHLKQADSRIATHVQMLADMRNVLTDAQRAQLEKMMSQPHPEHMQRFAAMHAKMRERMVANLHLTAPQKQALDELESQFKAQKPLAGMRQAFAAFVKSGDTQALTQALNGRAQKLPVDAIVNFASSLDQHQRTQVLHHFAAMRRHFAHMHG